MHFPNFKIERKLISSYNFIAGCDEVGMGPLAGPVVAAVCVIKPEDFNKRKSVNNWFARIRDSKKIAEKERIVLEDLIKKNCLAFGIGESSVPEINKLNIHHARLLAMQRACENIFKKTPELKKQNGIILIDGKFIIPKLKITQETFVGGDAKIISIAAASILAKNFRDRRMQKLHNTFPEYAFSSHKGYGTKKHIDAIRKFGSTKIHRKEFLKNIV